MALSKELEDLIVGLPEEDRAAMRASLEKHAVLREKFEGGLRQSDYDRKMNEVKATEKAAKDAEDKAKVLYEQNQQWFKDNKPILDRTTKERDDLFKLRDELEAKLKIAAAATATGDGKPVDQDALVAAVAERMKSMTTIPNEASLRTMMGEEALKIAATERENFFKGTLPGVLEFTMTIQELAGDFKDEFGEKFNRGEFIKYQNEQGMSDKPREAYDRYVAERRQKTHDAKLVEETTNRVKSELSVPGTGVSTALNLPGSSAIPEDGPMVSFLKANPGPAAGTGASAEAAKAAAELRQEGKF